jgi:hypothetical protein
MSSPKIYQVANLQSTLTTTADSANNRVLKAGDTMTGNLNVAATLITQNVIPNANVTYDLGTNTARFKDLWLSNSTIYLGEASISAQGGNVSFGNAEIQLSNVSTKLNVTNDLFVSGNVGIGTTSPTYTLDLLSSTTGYISRFKTSSNYGGILADAGSSGSAGGGYYAVAKNNTRYGLFGVSGAYIGDSSTDAALATESGSNLRFFTNGSNAESMRVTTAGNVGIGTTIPSTTLTVGHESHGVGIAYTGASAFPSIAGMFTDINSGQAGYGSLHIKARTDFGGFYSINFYTAASDNTPVEQVRITSGGVVGIGVTNPTNCKLAIKGDWVGGQSTVKAFPVTSFASGGLAGYGIFDSDGTTRKGYVAVTNSDMQIWNGSNTAMVIGTNDIERIRILNVGDVSFNNNKFSNFVINSYENNVIKPIEGQYGGFKLSTHTELDSGWILMRDGADVDVYQQYGLTVVTDRGPLTLAARGGNIGDNSPRNFIRFMTAGGAGSAQVRMTISKDGHITTPHQPAFHAYGASATSGNYVTYPSIYVNRGGHYSTGNGRFTAPVAGMYMFFWDAIGSSASDVFRWYLRKNGSNIGAGDLHLRQDTTATGGEYATNASRVAILDLAVNDYVQIYVVVDGESSIYAGQDYVTFGGYLLG